MASGLDNLFTTYGSDYGALGAYQAGQKRGLADTATRLANEQQSAVTQRYTGETPSYLRGKEAETRKAELSNLQPEAEAALGVPGVRAGTSLTEAKISAEKAEEVRRQLGPQKTMQMLHEIEQQSTATLGAMRQYLSQYPTADQAIAAFRQSHPQLTQDPSFNAEAAKYRGKPSAQALQELETSAASVAKGIANAKAETQAELLKVQAQGQNQKDVANIQGQYSLQGDRIRSASSGAGGSMNKYEALQYWGDQARNAATQEDYDYANAQFKAIQGEQGATGTSLVTGLPTGAKPKVDAPRPSHLSGQTPAPRAAPASTATPKVVAKDIGYSPDNETQYEFIMDNLKDPRFRAQAIDWVESGSVSGTKAREVKEKLQKFNKQTPASSGVIKLD